MWSQSYAGNSRYLASVSNGMGLYQSFTWDNARNNTQGVLGGGSNDGDPLYCNTHQSGICDVADDQAWSHIVLVEEDDAVVRLWQHGQGGQQSTKTITSTTKYTYQLAAYSANPCSLCTQGMYWGNQDDADYLDYYNGQFMGFVQTSVSHPDGSLTVHTYDATEGWGIYDTAQAPCFTTNPCHNDPWWDPTNALHGHEVETDEYDETNGQVLLAKTTTAYSVQCPPSGVSGTPAFDGLSFDGNLVSGLDHDNPVAACDIQTSEVDQYTYDGSTSGTHQETAYQYDSYGRVTQTTTTTNDGGATGSPTTIITKPVYIWNDAVSANPASVTGTYLIDFVAFTDVEDASGNRYSCTYTSYDSGAYATGQQSSLTAGLVTTMDKYTNCGTKANNFTDQSGLIRTITGYDAFGNPITTIDPDAYLGNNAHKGCTVNSVPYTTCTAYDTTFDALPVSTTNALNQTATLGYTATAAGGFGLWPTSTTDVNGQATTTTYDALGRETSQTLPGETSGETTTTTSYTFWCTPGNARVPCVEVDTTQRLNTTTTVLTRSFYDGFGHLVETRTQGPNNGATGQDIVQYHYYDAAGRDVVDSVPYFVQAYTGAAGANAYSLPDDTQAVTSTAYPNLRTITVTDALSDVSTSTRSVVCNAQGTDSACYVQTLSIDPLHHQSGMLTDALGREIYEQTYTGTGPYTLYTTTKYTYDFLSDLTKILQPGGGTTTTFQYDMVGRQTGMTDPDRGTESYVYDANGNVVQTTDARGSAGTIYAGYDGLNRQIWRNTTNIPTGAYVTYSYDSTANGNHGVGRLTGESFTGGPNQSLSGSYSYVYDVRGQPIQTTLTVGGTPYTTQTSYDDAGHVLTQTYPNGDVLTTSYTDQGWLAGLTLQQGSAQTTLLGNLSYTGTGGPAGLFSSASLNGGTYTESDSYDLLLRPTDSKVTRSSDQTTLYEEVPTYDSASRITGITTTLPQGTDVQQFCYDEQNRLTWAGSVGTPPCTNTAITPGTLTSAQYTQSFSYDTLGRLTSGPGGSYTYGDSAHVHAATAIGSSYTASYDAAGNMTCRAPTSATTCTGSQPTGAQLSYDNEGRLVAWQNAPSNPSSTDAYLYDGEGNRIEQQTVQNGTTTSTVYVGGLEEVTTSGTTTTTLTYYGGIAMAVNGVLSYLVTDGQGSLTEALDTSGNIEASQLYAPYGGRRYSSGTMPTSLGFTGQRQDALTGLYYFNARYYDPVAGQFISADTLLPGGGYDPWGLSRYAYVEGNPVNATDPSGHELENPDNEGGAGGDGGEGGEGGDGGFGGSANAGATGTDSVTTPFDVSCGCVPEEADFVDAPPGAAPTDGQTVEWIDPSTGNLEWENPDGSTGVVDSNGDVVTFNADGDQTSWDGVSESTGGASSDELNASSEQQLRQDEQDNANSGNSNDGNGNGNDGCGQSFSADTLVATPQGEQPISSLHVGDQVQAYDPQTQQQSTQTVEQV